MSTLFYGCTFISYNKFKRVITSKRYNRFKKQLKNFHYKNKILTKVYNICPEKSQMVFLGHLLCNFISFSFTYSYC